MKVILSYPPFKTDKGTPTLGQNRQFQYFKEPTYIYPVVPALAATLLLKNGFDVLWNDCLAENIIDENGYLDLIAQEDPDLIAFETKTPVVKQHWEIINKLKSQNPKLKTVLFGDHVTALPSESFENSRVDFVLTGGDYDFLLLNLCENLRSQSNNFEPGIWYRQDGRVINTGQFELNHDLNSLPFIDRDLTKWQLYAFKNGNYKLTPGTYIMSGRDCWWHKCTFCSWPTLYPKYRTRSAENVLDEIGQLINRYNVREIMDDTGTFPVGQWLEQFCSGMIKRGYNNKVNIDCNMRFGALSLDEYKLMKKAGFRLLLFGLESAHQETLDKIKKSVTVSEIIDSCKLARQAGLFPHITIMFGYPWETLKEAKKTLDLGKWLLKKGYAYTVQATIVVPYPGSPLFEECKRNNQLLTEDWDRFDMKESVMASVISSEDLKKVVQGIYSVAFNPEFIARKIFSISDRDDLRYFLRASKKVFGHLLDFSHKNQ
jgi:radical SAM superfamily enzyme YgiQ (UPF0313 family)